MSILANRYGVTRPRAITAMLRRLQVALPSIPVIEAAPVLALVPAAPSKAARVAAMQVERAQLRADLPFMRHYAANYDDGPTLDEIEAMESRLADLDDFLILEPETASTVPLLLAA
jgi:hypothetical protein